MKIGVLGTGVVGETIASALTDKKHLVRMGSRSLNNEKAEAWLKKSNDYASIGDFNDAASFGEIVFLALNGQHALDAVAMIDPENVAGKIVVDVTNPLDFSKGMPPRIIQGLGNNNSLGEEIQRALPGAFVVKALNTINCKLMVDPRSVNKGEHTLLLCGDNADAKNQLKHFLVDNFHWRADNLLDLGPIENARVTEAYVPLWASIMQALGTPMFSINVVK